ncbi:MAG TPA: hypothetical protein VIX40_03730 [Methylomirabilota bacterium]
MSTITFCPVIWRIQTCPKRTAKAASSVSRYSRATSPSPRESPDDVAVDGDLGEVGAGEVQRGHDHDEEEGDRDRGLVGAQVLEEADEQPPVVLLRERVLFVEGAGHAVRSISSSRSWRRCRSA